MGDYVNELLVKVLESRHPEEVDRLRRKIAAALLGEMKDAEAYKAKRVEEFLNVVKNDAEKFPDFEERKAFYSETICNRVEREFIDDHSVLCGMQV